MSEMFYKFNLNNNCTPTKTKSLNTDRSPPLNKKFADFVLYFTQSKIINED